MATGNKFPHLAGVQHRARKGHVAAHDVGGSLLAHIDVPVYVDLDVAEGPSLGEDADGDVCVLLGEVLGHVLALRVAELSLRGLDERGDALGGHVQGSSLGRVLAVNALGHVVIAPGQVVALVRLFALLVPVAGVLSIRHGGGVSVGSDSHGGIRYEGRSRVVLSGLREIGRGGRFHEEGAGEIGEIGLREGAWVEGGRGRTRRGSWGDSGSPH